MRDPIRRLASGRMAMLFLAALISGPTLQSCGGVEEPARSVPAVRPGGPRTVAPASRLALDAAGVLGAARDSVVVVESLDRRGHVVAQGSGVIVADRTVVTSWPLVSRAFRVGVRGETQTRTAVIQAVLEKPGLARLAAMGASTIDLGRDVPPPPRSPAYAVGFAQGLDVTVAEGLIVPAPDEAADLVHATAPAPSGFTGGGLFDARGDLVGILVAGPRPANGGSLAIPVRLVKDLLALPEGSIPQPTRSPLLRLPAADRDWLVDLMTTLARDGRSLGGLSLDRVNALLDRLDPLVGAELERVKLELGLGLLDQQRLFWEDAVEARAFGRAVRSSRRRAVERNLGALGILTARDLAQGDRIMRAIAAREPFDAPGERVIATEAYLSQRLTRTDDTRSRLQAQVWAARAR